MSGNWYAYIGTNAPVTDAIHCYRYEPETGNLEASGVAHTFDSPSYFAGRGTSLYAVSDSSAGAVAAYEIDRSTGLPALKNMLSAQGTSTCQLTLDRSGRHVYAANYGTGNFSGFSIGEGGELIERLFTIQHEGRSVNERRQTAPYVHCMTFTPDWKWLCVADLGVDRVEIYVVDEATGLVERDASRALTVPAGLGPRHLVFHPNGLYAYLVCEMGSAVLALRYDAGLGRFDLMQQVSTLPEGWQGNSDAAAIRVSADGRFLYASNRGHDSIACYAISPEDGSLSLLSIVPSGGRCPRDIALDPSGRFLFAANQLSGTVIRFDVNGKDGSLKQYGGEIPVPHASCIYFMQV